MPGLMAWMSHSRPPLGRGARDTTGREALILGASGDCFGGPEPEHDLVPSEDTYPQGSIAVRLQHAQPRGLAETTPMAWGKLGCGHSLSVQLV